MSAEKTDEEIAADVYDRVQAAQEPLDLLLDAAGRDEEEAREHASKVEGLLEGAVRELRPIARDRDAIEEIEDMTVDEMIEWERQNGGNND